VRVCVQCVEAPFNYTARRWIWCQLVVAANSLGGSNGRFRHVSVFTPKTVHVVRSEKRPCLIHLLIRSTTASHSFDKRDVRRLNRLRNVRPARDSWRCSGKSAAWPTVMVPSAASIPARVSRTTSKPTDLPPRSSIIKNTIDGDDIAPSRLRCTAYNSIHINERRSRSRDFQQTKLLEPH